MSRQPRRAGGDRTLRAVVVVALLALAASALQARRGLDWDAISDPVEIEWVRVAAAVLALLVLAQLARPMLRRLRRQLRRRHRPPGSETDGPEGERIPWWMRLLAVGFVLTGLYVAWVLIGALLPEVSRAEPATRTEDPSGSPGAPIDMSGSWVPLVIAGAVLLAVALVGHFSAVRRAGAHQHAGRDAADDEAVRLDVAVAAAQVQLAAHDDPRAAIVAAYNAMAASLTAGLARLPAPGSAARPSDTPTELLARAVRSGVVSPGPATTLTDLFREARFSRHPMGPAERRAAEGALAMVRAELSGALHV